MDIQEAIVSRRSIRRYSNQTIPLDMIKRIIEAGTWAPTACNEQAFRFLIVDQKTVFERLVREGTAGFVKNIAYGVLVLYRNTTQNREYMDHIQSGAACVQNMLLKAHELGIGSCWVCNLPSQSRMRHLFGIPSFYSVIALVTLGMPTQVANSMPRRNSLDDVISHNHFLFEEHIPTGELLKMRMRAFLRFLYYRLPKFPLLIKVAEYLEKKFQN